MRHSVYYIRNWGPMRKLTEAQREREEVRWAGAVRNRQVWRESLIYAAGEATNRNARDVLAAWGLPR